MTDPGNAQKNRKLKIPLPPRLAGAYVKVLRQGAAESKETTWRLAPGKEEIKMDRNEVLNKLAPEQRAYAEKLDALLNDPNNREKLE